MKIKCKSYFPLWKTIVLQVEKLKSELDEALLSEKQLKHKVDHLKDVIASKAEELHIMSERVQETMSSEVLSLQLELLSLEQGKVCLGFILKLFKCPVSLQYRYFADSNSSRWLLIL